LDSFYHINRTPFNQLILIHHLELIKVQTIPTTNQQSHYTKGWKHGKVDKKRVAPKMQSKNDKDFDINTLK